MLRNEHAELSVAEFRTRRRHRHAARNGPAVRCERDCAARRRYRSVEPISGWPVAQDGRPRTSRHYRRGDVWRHANGISGAHRRHGGNLARVGVSRSFLRRAFEPLRQPDSAQWQRSAEAQISAEADLGRARGCAGDERTGRRLRRRIDAATRRSQRRSLRLDGKQDVDHQWARRRYARRVCKNRSARRVARHHRVFDRKGNDGFLDGAEARQARHARLEYLRACVRRLRGAHGERPRPRR